MARRPKAPPSANPAPVQKYQHSQQTTARPEIGAAPRFKTRREPATYRYDSSLSPALDWDTNPARDIAAWLMHQIEQAAPLPNQTFPNPQELLGADGKPLLTVSGLQDALAALKRMNAPFLNWAGKAERSAFEVPTLPLFVHERLSTEAIITTLDSHRKRPTQNDLFQLFADPQLPLNAQVDAYKYKSGWVNRMILGDSLAVMNSLAKFEGLAGQVQCIYMDPPYGVKFGSNFQPFVRKRDVKDNDDADMTREPEMVQAYRDTWSLGIHSYLTYLRNRLLAARGLLTISGSIFVQISDENLHHVRELLDEVFGADCHVVTIVVKKKGSQKSSLIDPVNDYVFWYTREARESGKLKYRALFDKREFDSDTLDEFRLAELPSGHQVNLSSCRSPQGDFIDYRNDPERFRRDYPDAKVFRPWPITNGGFRTNQMDPVQFDGRTFYPPAGRCWSFRSRSEAAISPMDRLRETGRLWASGSSLDGKRYLSDFPFKTISNWWDGFGGAASPIYVVQTNSRIVQRCMLMTTDPGDIVLDPTCGSGTTAYVAEQWGRRWITIDTSRVPLALARQRLLTATYPWYTLRDETIGPAAGFIYARRQNRNGDEIGGIVPHLTLGSIANNEQPQEEILVDRPEQDDSITRVSGPFVVEAALPTPQPLDEPQPSAPPAEPEAPADHILRMIEVLRKSPTLSLPGNARITLKNIRRPARTLNLSAEATVDHDTSGATAPLAEVIDAAHATNTNALPFTARPVAILFGPPDGSITARAVYQAAREANIKNYAHLYIIGFGFTAEAQADIDAGEDLFGLPVSRVTITLDLLMGDLLKTQRSSQIFAITGSPEITVTKLAEPDADGSPRWQATLLGLDSFDPTTMNAHHLAGDNVPMWMLDTAWNGMVFRADQVFFPRTAAWENLKKTLKSTHEESVWDHLKGNTSAPFAALPDTDIAIKVLDDRGNELLKIHHLT